MANVPDVGDIDNEALYTAAQGQLHALLRGGHFRKARQLLGNRRDASSLIERARLAFLLDNDLNAADVLATQARDAVDATNGQRLLARLFRACFAACRGSSLGIALDVKELSAIEPSMLSEVVYYAAHAAYFAHDLATAESWLTFHRPQEPEWQARYLVVRGLIAAGREDFAKQMDLTTQALDALEAGAPDASYLIANAGHLLAVLCREVPPTPTTVGRLEQLLENIGNDDGYTGSRFHIVRSLAWSRALAGRYTSAMRFALHAMQEAANDIQRLYACLDHALIAVFAGEQRSSSALAAYEMARELVTAIDWPSIVTDDLAALPLAAQVAAEFGVLEDAKRFCAIALASKGHVTSRLALPHDSRYEALLNEATALAYADEDRKRAIEAAANAYETYKRIGFDWRAARMAILLYQMTRAEAWKARAVRSLGSYPQGPFHRLLERPRALTKRQEDVLRLVRLGFDDYRIAEELGISYKTVRIHLDRLFKCYGVKNRSALMAKATFTASAS